MSRHYSIFIDYNLQAMLAFLPLLVWVLLYFLWLDDAWDSKGTWSRYRSIRGAVLCVTIVWGSILALMSEGLSLIHELNRGGVALGWGIILGLLCWIGFPGKRFERGAQRLWTTLRQVPVTDWLLFGLAGLISIALLVVALLSPANNTDSLEYHLSRVVHWAQDASLQHYATAYIQQLSFPIWAEEVMLHLRLLWGDDRLAGLAQWGAMLASLVAVTLIAAELGVGRVGQWLAAAFAFGLPMGVLQATSTQNDYVVAFWLLCTAWLVIQAVRVPISHMEAILLGMAVGLGLLTKGTFYPFAVPLGIWFLIGALRWGRKDRLSWRVRSRLLLQASAFIILSVLVINMGYWIRNMLTFHSPLGPLAEVENLTASQYGPGPLVAAMIRNVVVNFVTPSQHINTLIVQFLRAKLLPLDSRMANFNLVWGWNHEDLAGNPLHVILIAVALLVLLLTWKHVRDHRLWAYLAAVGGVFLMLSAVIHDDLYGIRYQISLFILGAPLFGAAFNLPGPGADWDGEEKRIKGTASNRWELWTLVVFLLAASLPWVVLNRTRPLIALKNGSDPFSIPCQRILGCTSGSILIEPPVTTLFANWIQLRDPYLKMSIDLKSTSCQQIGLRLDSHDPEYFFWWLLDAPQSGRLLETIYAIPETERYLNPTFRPCAVICTICGERTRAYGLPLLRDYGPVKLFTGPGFMPNLDP